MIKYHCHWNLIKVHYAIRWGANHHWSSNLGSVDHAQCTCPMLNVMSSGTFTDVPGYDDWLGLSESFQTVPHVAQNMFDSPADIGTTVSFIILFLRLCVLGAFLLSASAFLEWGA